MDNIITRHRNLTILAVVLFAQLLGLAYQVKKTTDRGSTRLMRIWAVTLITPLEKAVVHSVSWTSNSWRQYVYLRDVRRENEELRDEIQRLRLEQVRMAQDAGQARRLQALLGFKEQFISQTMAAQIISTTGSEFSRGVYIDKGTRDGVKSDMPVLTADGVVGKVYRVYPTSSLVLEINDPSSGAGVILEKSRLQGILKGSPNGETFVANIMADEQVQPGEQVLTSGGDRVYPKGLAIGAVTKVSPAGTFLNVQVKPAARLDRLEEVLVITKIVEKFPDVNTASGPVRAIDILAERLPSVPPPKPADDKSKAAAGATASSGTAVKPAAGAAAQPPASVGSAKPPTGTTASPGTVQKETAGTPPVTPPATNKAALPGEKNPGASGSGAVAANPAVQTPRLTSDTTPSKPSSPVKTSNSGVSPSPAQTGATPARGKPNPPASAPASQAVKKPLVDAAKPEKPKPAETKPDPPRGNEH